LGGGSTEPVGRYIERTGRSITIEFNHNSVQRQETASISTTSEKKKGVTLLKSEGVCAVLNSEFETSITARSLHLLRGLMGLLGPIGFPLAG
jgi:hypothetical protein